MAVSRCRYGEPSLEVCIADTQNCFGTAKYDIPDINMAGVFRVVDPTMI